MYKLPLCEYIMVFNSSEKKIKDFLLQKKLVSVSKMAEIEDKVRRNDKTLEDTLVQEKVFTSKDFNNLKGEVFGLPVVDLSELTIESAVLNILTQKVAQNYQMVIFAKRKMEVSVGMVRPDDFQAHEAVEFLCNSQGFRPKYFVISAQDCRTILNQYSGFKKEIGSAVAAAEEKFAKKEKLVSQRGDSNENMGEVIKSAPVAKIVSVIFKHALEGGASDIHIEPGFNEGRVRYRVDGMLRTSLTLPNYLYPAVISRIKVLANLKLDEMRLPQDGRIRTKVDDQDVDLRVSVLPTIDQEKVVIRVFDSSTGVPTLAELGFNENHISIIERNIKKPYGLFLLTGPTGSGKTTTLYSVLNMINAETTNIVTLEDPVEYYIDGISQSQINADIGFTFVSGLRAVLRQDPNIIMVGEIRDNDTVELVIHAGLTGHLVFSTLHTNNAWGAIPRLVDMKAEPFLLSSTLNLVMAQRLVRKICPDCKEEIKLTPNILAKIQDKIDTIPPVYLEGIKKTTFYKGKGCQSCSNSGYSGRMVVGEILEMDSAMKDLISTNYNSSANLEEALKHQNFISLTQDAVLKALQGFTTVEEVIRVSQEQ